ncbi:hypothetical protein HHI36_004022 [Cryptolaemus montrouzieri]|uniref:Uncharacterized protein n=1 Tax=Cryptolaemus montrouzieri TaxID=559131 RepID=A0ABD2NRJ6_9CUCU
MILKTIEKNANMRVLRSKLSNSKTKLTKMKNKKKEFYTNLYTSKSPNVMDTSSSVLNVGSEDLPDICLSEIRSALKSMRNGKCLGENHITAEMLKLSGGRMEELIQIY